MHYNKLIREINEVFLSANNLAISIMHVEINDGCRHFQLKAQSNSQKKRVVKNIKTFDILRVSYLNGH